MIIKADKQATHKHYLTANVYNDPNHAEPFDIALPEPADIHIWFWWFFFPSPFYETAIDQLNITAQGYSFQTTLFPALILLFNTPKL